MSADPAAIPPWRLASVLRINSDRGRIPTCCHSVSGREWSLIVGYGDGSLRCYSARAPGEQIGTVNCQVVCTVATNSTLAVADVAGRLSLFRNGSLYDRIQGRDRLSHLSIERLFANNYNIAAACGEVVMLFGGTQIPVQIKLPGCINALVPFNHECRFHAGSVRTTCIAVSIVGSNDIVILANGEQLGVLQAPVRPVSMCSGKFMELAEKRTSDDADDLAIVSYDGEIYIYSKGEFHHWASIGYSAQAIYQCQAPEGLDISDAIACIGHFNGWKFIHQGKIVIEYPGDNSWVHSCDIHRGKSTSILSCISYCNVVQSYEIEWPPKIIKTETV